MKWLLPIALFASLGCCKPQVIVVPAPVPPKVERPVLRIKSLPPNASVKDVIEAYVLDLQDQVGYSNQLEILIWGKK